MGFVYMIKCNITNECYIGSSVQKNKNIRLRHHKGKYNECVSKQIINRNNYEYIILEDIFDINKKELRIKEQEYIDKYDCINKLRAYRSQEQKKQRRKEYYKNNKEYIIEHNKKYQGQWRKNNKEYIKEYNEKNKEKIKEYKKEYNKQYIQNNKEKRKKYQKEYRFFNKYNDVIADYINDINKY